MHESHFGITKTKARASQVVYWPGMSRDIEEMIVKCTICEKYSNANVKEPLISHEIPNIPFYKVASDILQFEGENYLVLQDYYSKWLEIVRLKNKTGTEVIEKLKTIFSIHGIPSIMICDNQPYNSNECNEFAKRWCFKIITSSPHYPRSNGLAERAVQTAKNILKKARQENIDIELALLEYRNSPIPGLNVSPAQIMFNRRVRTKIPVHTKLLQPEIPQNVHRKLMERQALTKNYHDTHAKKREQFREGESVLVRNGKVWEPVKIVSMHDTPRSYLIINRNGNTVRRNSSHLKKTKTEFALDGYDEDYDSCVKRNECDKRQDETTDQNNSITPKNVIEGQQQEPKVTRSGRAVKTPAKLKDYVLSK